MNTSRYFNIDDRFLIEYIYYDATDPLEYNTNGTLYKMTNSDTGQNYLFSSDSEENTTGNVRDRSAVLLDKTTNKWGQLNIDIPLPINDYYNNLTNTASLPLTFAPNYDLKFDKIRIHIVSGYNFEDIEGFIFQVKCKYKNGINEFNLASLSYLKSDTYAVINPKPILLGERLFGTYIDLEIPAIEYLIQDQLVTPGDTNLLGYKMTDGNLINTNSNIYINFEKIRKTEVVNGFRYLYTYDQYGFAIPRVDEYSDIIASVEESANGDFFELSAKQIVGLDEIPISDWIAFENLQPETDYIIIHNIRVLEQIYYSIIETSNYNFVQDSDFDNPILFRPIIKNYNSFSFFIEYSVTLYNRINGESILKRSSVNYTAAAGYVAKYGRYFQKINLGVLPTTDKIYNIIKDIKMDYFPTIQNSNPSIKYISNFIETANINVSFDIALYDEDNIPSTNQQINPLRIYSNGEALIPLNQFDNFIKFTLFNTNNNNNTVLSLSEIGTMYLVFIDDNDNEVRINNTLNDKISPSNGEVLFKIYSEIAKKIIKFKNNTFNITLKPSDDTDETLIYSGKFESNYTANDKKFFNLVAKYQSQITSNEKSIEKLKNININLKSEIDVSNAEIKAKDELIALLNAEIEALKNGETFNKDKYSTIRPAEKDLSNIKENNSKTKIYNTNLINDKSVKTKSTTVKSIKNGIPPLRNINN